MTDNLSDDANSVSTAVIAEYSLVSEKIALQIFPPTALHRRKHDQRSKPHSIMYQMSVIKEEMCLMPREHLNGVTHQTGAKCTLFPEIIFHETFKTYSRY